MTEKIPYVEIIREEVKKYAQFEYLFFLDPDEIVPEQLASHLKEIYKEYDYIKIPRKNIIFGKWIEHSRWWPDYQVRLFKKNAAVWPKEIHQQPQVKGKGHSVEAKEEYAVLHYNYETIDEFMTKALRYAKSEAQYLYVKNKTLTFGESLKKALSEFISRYFEGQGYKDDMHGLILGFLQIFYYFLVYIYYWEIKKYPEESQEEMQKVVISFFQDGLFSVYHWQDKYNLSEQSFIGKLKRLLIKKLLSK